ncbi:MAG: SH3 domain-containing protein [Pseudomonadota bacterium]
MHIAKSLKLSALVLTVVSSFATSAVLAKNISLYEEPKTDSKVVASIDSSSTLVPIFSNKSGDWMKVGDPKNGNVGWIKVSDLSTSKGDSESSGFSMTEQTVGTPNGPQTYRTIQFGNGSPMGSDQAQSIIQKIQTQQAQIQKNTQQMYNNLYRDMNALYLSNPAAFSNGGFPVFMPVIVIPQQATTTVPVTPNKPATPVKSTVPPKS